MQIYNIISKCWEILVNYINIYILNNCIDLFNFISPTIIFYLNLTTPFLNLCFTINYSFWFLFLNLKHADLFIIIFPHLILVGGFIIYFSCIKYLKNYFLRKYNIDVEFTFWLYLALWFNKLKTLIKYIWKKLRKFGLKVIFKLSIRLRLWHIICNPKIGTRVVLIVKYIVYLIKSIAFNGGFSFLVTHTCIGFLLKEEVSMVGAVYLVLLYVIFITLQMSIVKNYIAYYNAGSQKREENQKSFKKQQNKLKNTILQETDPEILQEAVLRSKGIRLDILQKEAGLGVADLVNKNLPFFLMFVSDEYIGTYKGKHLIEYEDGSLISQTISIIRNNHIKVTDLEIIMFRCTPSAVESLMAYIEEDLLHKLPFWKLELLHAYLLFDLEHPFRSKDLITTLHSYNLVVEVFLQKNQPHQLRLLKEADDWSEVITMTIIEGSLEDSL